MDRPESSQCRTETRGRVEAANSNDVSSRSPQDHSGPSRLLYQIRSMPLVSLLLGRNVSARNVINDANSFFLLKCIMGVHLIILIILVALSTFTIYYYNIRFYKSQTRPSETLIVCWLLRGIWRTLNSTWSLRYYCAGTENTPNLKLSHTFYNLASILWIGLAVIFLGVSPKEDLKSVSSKICYFLLWTTIASYVVPMLAYTLMCLLLYLTLFIVIYFRHGSIPLSSSATPMSLLKKLKVQKYKDVLKSINASEKLEKLYGESEIGSRKLTDMEVINRMAMNDPLTDCVNNAEMLADRICSICILKINDDDKVFILPCDMRHLFHRDCLKKWFKRSSECPICRSNISVILSLRDNTANKEQFREVAESPEELEQNNEDNPDQQLGQYPVHEIEEESGKTDEEEGNKLIHDDTVIEIKTDQTTSEEKQEHQSNEIHEDSYVKSEEQLQNTQEEERENGEKSDENEPIEVVIVESEKLEVESEGKDKQS